MRAAWQPLSLSCLLPLPAELQGVGQLFQASAGLWRLNDCHLGPCSVLRDLDVSVPITLETLPQLLIGQREEGGPTEAVSTEKAGGSSGAQISI